MKILRIAGIALGAIIALLLILAAVEPGKTVIERATVINKPVSEVFAYVADLKNFDQWNYWYEFEPTAKITVSAQSIGVGAVYSWEGAPDKTGTGTTTITQVDPEKYIAQKIVFKVPFEGESMAGYRFEAAEGGTKITYWYEADAPYPVGRLTAMFMIKGMLGDAYEKSLANLKKKLESMPATAPEEPKKEEGKEAAKPGKK